MNRKAPLLVYLVALKIRVGERGLYCSSHHHGCVVLFYSSVAQSNLPPHAAVRHPPVRQSFNFLFEFIDFALFDLNYEFRTQMTHSRGPRVHF